MRRSPRQFTLGSLMIAIAIIAVALAVPLLLLAAVAVGAVYLILCILVSSVAAYLLIIVPGYVLLDRFDRWRDGRRVSFIRRTTGGVWRDSRITILDPGSSGE